MLVLSATSAFLMLPGMVGAEHEEAGILRIEVFSQALGGRRRRINYFPVLGWAGIRTQ